jgi:hypothetical protein
MIPGMDSEFIESEIKMRMRVLPGKGIAVKNVGCSVLGGDGIARVCQISKGNGALC